MPATPPIAGYDAAFTTGVTNLLARGSSVLPLGNATGAAYTDTLSVESFENGWMFYSLNTNKIYVLSRTGVQLSTYANAPFESGQATFIPGPRPGTYIPVRGFGVVWQQNAVVQQLLGLATAQERGYTAQVQAFERGFLLDDPGDSLIFALNTQANVWDSAGR